MITRHTTKTLLAESLKFLAKSKPVDKITVRELTKHCGLTAPTFYNNFRDKYELAAWIYNQQFDAALENFNASRDFEAFIYRCIEILFEDEIFYRNALKNFVGQNSFRYTTNDHAIKAMAAWLSERHELTAELSCCLWFYMRAVSETINDWFLGSREISARELTKFLVEWMPAPLKPLIL